MTGLGFESWFESGIPLSKSQEGLSVELWDQLVVMTPGNLISKSQPCLASSDKVTRVADTPIMVASVEPFHEPVCNHSMLL